jgi:hypothetical protein
MTWDRNEEFLGWPECCAIKDKRLIRIHGLKKEDERLHGLVRKSSSMWNITARTDQEIESQAIREA